MRKLSRPGPCSHREPAAGKSRSRRDGGKSRPAAPTPGRQNPIHRVPGGRRAQSTLSGRGIGADLTRAYALQLESADPEKAAERELQRSGFTGSGSYTFGDPREPGEAFAIAARFEIASLSSLDRGYRLRLFLNTDPRPGPLTLLADDNGERVFRCLPLDYTVASTIMLPDGINLSEKPLGFTEERNLTGETRYGAATGQLRLEGGVSLEGRSVRAVAHLTASFDAPVCPATFYASIKQFLQKGSEFSRTTVYLTPKPVARVIERGSTYQAGLDAYRAANYARALKEWLPIAELGDSDAQVYLGSMYRNGYGVTRDYEQALAWCRKAAERDNALAQSHLAFMYGNGLGVAADAAQALAWYRKAAERGQGNATAQYDLGYAYESGYGVKADTLEAKQWYARAASQGHLAAQARLASLQTSGAVIDVLKRALGIAVQ